LILIFRDVAIAAPEPDTALWSTQVQQINKLFPACNSAAAVHTIEETKDALKRKVHLQLALTALFFELRKHMRGIS
jgi:hypothetical protein